MRGMIQPGMTPEFPRIYQKSRGGRVIALLCGLPVAALCLWGLAGADGVLLGFWLGILLVTAYLVIAAFRVRVVLLADAVENHGVFSVRRMTRDEIQGYRMLNSTRIHLVSGIQGVRALTLASCAVRDGPFSTWLSGIRNLDHEDSRMHAVLVAGQLGGTRQERHQIFERARRTAVEITVITLVVCVWLGFFPDSMGLASSAAILLPWIAVVMMVRMPALYRVNVPSHQSGAALWVPLCLPGIPLAYRAFVDAHVLDGEQLFWICLAVTAACIALLCWRLREMRELRNEFGEAVLIGFCLFLYVYGVVTLANRELDRGTRESFVVEVLDARVSGESHYLRLSPWGPRSRAEDVDVGEELYARSSKGDRVCVGLGAGAFGVRWFNVRNCAAD